MGNAINAYLYCALVCNFANLTYSYVCLDKNYRRKACFVNFFVFNLNIKLLEGILHSMDIMILNHQ